MILLALLALILALLPTIMTFVNLSALREPPPAPDGGSVSVLIPARNEEAGIVACVECALASKEIDLDVVVLDDHSTDATAALVKTIAERDRRVRLVPAPALPAGWSGKQHACHVLSTLSSKPIFVFVDADVRLAPEAGVRLAGALQHADLVSCVPRQDMGSATELLLIPLINSLLLGYLPIPLMRRDGRVALGAGCGQLIAVRAEAYRRAGGHAGIRHSLHDGLLLPRLFRRAGLRTDLVEGVRLASCRMYVGARATLAGSLKNAHEGLAKPLALPIWTVLLLGGHILPWLALIASLMARSLAGALIAVLACAGLLAARAMQASRCQEPLQVVVVHSFGVLLLVCLQWIALARHTAGRPSTWRGRTYPVRS